MHCAKINARPYVLMTQSNKAHHLWVGVYSNLTEVKSKLYKKIYLINVHFFALESLLPHRTIGSHSCEYQTIYRQNKKVLLRERKRHTARRVVSTPSVVLTGYPPSWPGRVPPPRCLPHGILGNVAKHYGIWVPPRVCPMAFWEMLQSIMGYGYPLPPWTDRLMDGRTDTCQNITFPSYYVRGW